MPPHPQIYADPQRPHCLSEYGPKCRKFGDPNYSYPFSLLHSQEMPYPLGFIPKCGEFEDPNYGYPPSLLYSQETSYPLEFIRPFLVYNTGPYILSFSPLPTEPGS